MKSCVARILTMAVAAVVAKAKMITSSNNIPNQLVSEKFFNFSVCSRSYLFLNRDTSQVIYEVNKSGVGVKGW